LATPRKFIGSAIWRQYGLDGIRRLQYPKPVCPPTGEGDPTSTRMNGSLLNPVPDAFRRKMRIPQCPINTPMMQGVGSRKSNPG
jgi:hypothetical protein